MLLAVGLLAAGGGELWVGFKAETVANLVRSELTDEGLAQHRADYEQARTVFEGLDDEVIPAAAAGVGIEEAQLRALVDVGYPDVASVISQRDELLAFAESGLTNLEQQQGRFERADSLPVPGLPAWTSSLLTLLLAAMLLSAGGLMFAGKAGAGLTAAGTVAALLIVVPLVLQAPGKAADTQEVLDSLSPTDAAVSRTEAAFATANAGWLELDERLLPDLATVAGTDREGLDTLIAVEFPEVAAGLVAMPGIIERYGHRARVRADGAADLRTLKSVPIRQLGWFGPAYGGAVALVVAAGVAVLRRGSGNRRDDAEPAGID